MQAFTFPSSTLSTAAPAAALTPNNNIKWDAKKYAKNSSPQLERALQALDWCGFFQQQSRFVDRTLIDMGFGNGKVLRIMAEATAGNVRVIGVDKDPSMVALAKEESKDLPNVKVLLGDMQTFQSLQPAAFIFSSFALQWVPAQHIPTTLKMFYHNLESGGEFCAATPLYDFPHEVIKNVAYDPKAEWYKYFKNYEEKQTFFSARFYEAELISIGFTAVRVKSLESKHPKTAQEFIDYTYQWCGCYMHLKDENLKAKFITAVRTKLEALEQKTTNPDRRFDMVQKSVFMYGKKSNAALVVSASNGLNLPKAKL